MLVGIQVLSIYNKTFIYYSLFAGQIEHRNFCQEFPLGRGYSIAFLERNPVNSNDTQNFVPSDFVDMIYQKNITDRLLADTCGMKATLPMGAMEMIRDVCPMVSTTSRCMEPPNTTTMGKLLGIFTCEKNKY